MVRNRRRKQQNRDFARETASPDKPASYERAMVARAVMFGRTHLLPDGHGAAATDGVVIAGVSRQRWAGRTTTTFHVGAGLARDGARVLLVDLTHSEALTTLCRAERALRRLPADNATLLQRFVPVAYPYARDRLHLLSLPHDIDAHRFEQLLRLARREFEIVLVDTESGADTDLVLPVTDGVFSVIGFNRRFFDTSTRQLSPGYVARTKAIEARQLLFDWLDDELDKFYETRDENDFESTADPRPPDVKAYLDAFLATVTASGRAQFGATEWEIATAQWRQNTEDSHFLKDSPDDADFDEDPPAVNEPFNDIYVQYPEADDDVVIVQQELTSAYIAEQVRQANKVNGIEPDQVPHGRHLGIVLVGVPRSVELSPSLEELSDLLLPPVIANRASVGLGSWDPSVETAVASAFHRQREDSRTLGREILRRGRVAVRGGM